MYSKVYWFIYLNHGCGVFWKAQIPEISAYCYFKQHLRDMYEALTWERDVCAYEVVGAMESPIKCGDPCCAFVFLITKRHVDSSGCSLFVL